MNGEDAGRRQRAVMATDEEWERISRRASASGMEQSRFLIQRALAPDALPPEVLRRAVREMLGVQSRHVVDGIESEPPGFLGPEIADVFVGLDLPPMLDHRFREVPGSFASGPACRP